MICSLSILSWMGVVFIFGLEENKLFIKKNVLINGKYCMQGIILCYLIHITSKPNTDWITFVSLSIRKYLMDIISASIIVSLSLLIDKYLTGMISASIVVKICLSIDTWKLYMIKMSLVSIQNNSLN